jgi:HEPN domain-containing protein
MEPLAELAKMHLMNADDELEMSERVLYKAEPQYWAALFHAQQSVEESLTGLLTYNGISADDFNNIEDLLNRGLHLLPELEKIKDKVSLLASYDTESNNTAQYNYVMKEEAAEAVDIAREIFESVFNFIQDFS